jgi:hypothetical protein
MFAKRPSKDNWKEFSYDFTILHPLADPYFYVQHMVKVGGAWKSAYCLGTPQALVNGKLEMDPAGVEKCESIILPIQGTQINLHESAGQMEDASTSLNYRYIIANWSGNAVQIADFNERMLASFSSDKGGGMRMFDVINEYMRAKGQVDLTAFTWRFHCEQNGGSWRNNIDSIGESLWKTRDELGAFMRQEGFGKRFQECKDKFGAAMTYGQICEKLGVQPSVGPAGLTEGENYFGQDQSAYVSPTQLGSGQPAPAAPAQDDPLACLNAGSAGPTGL